MSVEEYFGDWVDIIDTTKAEAIVKKIVASRKSVCPKIKDIFQAFRLCSFADTKVVFLGLDPYPNLKNGVPVATGIAFGNSKSTQEKDYSPSLKVLKDSIKQHCQPQETFIFDPSLEGWEKQGVLLLNSSLTCLSGNTGSHLLLWKPFVEDLLLNMTLIKDNLIYVLMGNVAQSFIGRVSNNSNLIIQTKHPSWYARAHNMLPDIWTEINKCLLGWNKKEIQWYNN